MQTNVLKLINLDENTAIVSGFRLQSKSKWQK